MFFLFCSLAVLDPRVGYTMDVLSPFISDLCHSDWSPVHVLDALMLMALPIPKLELQFT